VEFQIKSSGVAAPGAASYQPPKQKSLRPPGKP
jgi:hypothetical protein